MDALPYYNVSLHLNLSSIVNWPIRIARLRFADAGSALARFSLDNYSYIRMDKQAPPPPPQASDHGHVPTPFAFSTSGYGVGLLAMVRMEQLDLKPQQC